MKTKKMEVRLEAEEMIAFQAAASLANLPLSAWVRARLRAASLRELKAVGRKPLW
jgi:hypothetical protein